LRFRMWFRGNLLELGMSQDCVEASMVEGREAVEMDILGQRQLLKPGGVVRAER